MTGVSEAALSSEAIDLIPSVRLFCTCSPNALKHGRAPSFGVSTLNLFCCRHHCFSFVYRKIRPTYTTTTTKSVNSRGAFALLCGSTLETSWLPPAIVSHEKNVRTFSGDTRAQSEVVQLSSSRVTRSLSNSRL